MVSILHPFLSRYVGPAPTGIDLSPPSLVEDAAQGTGVGNLIVQPATVVTGTWSILDNTKFQLSATTGNTSILQRSGTGTLTGGVNETVTIRFVDAYGQAAQQAFSIPISAAEAPPDVAPTMTGQTVEVSASAALGAVVATSIITNSPYPAALTKTIESGNGAGAFGISGINTVVADTTALASLVGTSPALGTKVSNGIAPDATATETINVVANADTAVSAATLYNYGGSTLTAVRHFFGCSFVDGDMPAGSYPVLKDGASDITAKVSAVSRYASGAMRFCRMEFSWSGSILAGASKALTIAARVGTYADAPPASKASVVASIIAAEGGYKHTHDLGTNGNADDGIWEATLAHALGGSELDFNSGTGAGNGYADKDRGHRFLAHNAVCSLIECFTYVRNTSSSKYHHFIKTMFWVIRWHGSGDVWRTGMTFTDRLYGATDDATHGGRTTPQSYLYDATVAATAGTLRSYAGQTTVTPHFRHGFRAGWFGCGDDPRAWDVAVGGAAFPTAYMIQDPAYVALETGIVPYPLISGVVNAADAAITYKPYFDDGSLHFNQAAYDIKEYDNTIGHPVAEKIFRTPGDANTFRKLMAIGLIPAAHPIFTSIYDTGLQPNILASTTGMAVLGPTRSTAVFNRAYDANANQMTGGAGTYGSWNVTAQHADSLNIAHYPEFSSTPYVVTADPRFLYLLQNYACNTNIVNNHVYRRLNVTGTEWQETAGTTYYSVWGARILSQERSSAWAIRSHYNAARLTPEDDPHKTFLTTVLTNNLNYLAAKYPNTNTTFKALGHFGAAGPQSRALDRAFQKEYMGMVFGWIAATGDIGAAAAFDFFENHMRKHLIRRFLDALTTENDRYFVVNYEHNVKVTGTDGLNDWRVTWADVIDNTKLGAYGGTGQPTGFNGMNGADAYDGSARACLWFALKAGITDAAAALAAFEARKTWTDADYNSSNFKIRFAYGRGT